MINNSRGSMKMCNIYMLDVLSFALGIQNVFVVKVTNRNYTHNMFCIPQLRLGYKKHAGYISYIWYFCSIKRCNIYGLMVIMWPSPKSPVSLQFMCRLFKLHQTYLRHTDSPFTVVCSEMDCFLFQKKNWLKRNVRPQEAAKKHLGGLVRPTSCTRTSRRPPLAAHMFYTTYKTLWSPVIAIDMLLCGLRPTFFLSIMLIFMPIS